MSRADLHLPGEQKHLRNIAYRIYNTRSDCLAEATLIANDQPDERLPDTTFDYLAHITNLPEIEKPYLCLFGMSREDTFRLICGLDAAAPSLVRDVLREKRDRLCMLRMRRTDDAPVIRGATINRSFSAECVLDTRLF